MPDFTVEELLRRLDQQGARLEELEARLAARESLVSRPQGTGVVSRGGLLKIAALGAVGTAGGLALANGPENAEAASGRAAFQSKTSSPTVSAKNTGSGTAISAKSGAGTTITASQTSKSASAAAIRGSIEASAPGPGASAIVESISASTADSSGVTGTHAGNVAPRLKRASMPAQLAIRDQV